MVENELDLIIVVMRGFINSFVYQFKSEQSHGGFELMNRRAIPSRFFRRRAANQRDPVLRTERNPIPGDSVTFRMFCAGRDEIPCSRVFIWKRIGVNWNSAFCMERTTILGNSMKFQFIGNVLEFHGLPWDSFGTYDSSKQLCGVCFFFVFFNGTCHSSMKFPVYMERPTKPWNSMQFGFVRNVPEFQAFP